MAAAVTTGGRRRIAVSGPGHTSFVIRLGAPCDLPAASEVFRRASLSNADDRADLLAHPEHLVLGAAGLAEGRMYVAEVDGAIVGFATWTEADGVVELEDLFVDPAWMRRGIATALVSRVVEDLRAMGAQRLHVTANAHALRFYLAAGFQADGVADTAFGPGSRMSVDIRSPGVSGQLVPRDCLPVSEPGQ